MALHACILGKKVVDIVNVTEDLQLQELFKIYTSVVDIDNLILKPEIGWILTEPNTFVPDDSSVDIGHLIKSRIEYYQKNATALLTELYVENTLAGITLQQSDQMFDEFQDVLIRLREGAWPTALERLNSKTPSGFATQELIDSWKAKILAKMNSQ